MKRDPRILTLVAEKLLQTLDNPLHRTIAANYRLHAMLEVSGRGAEIFRPDMTVDHPVYHIDRATTVKGDAVLALYQSLVDQGTSIMILAPEHLIVGDWGLASEALFHTYLTGTAARNRGFASADPAKKYIQSHWICMMWPYDEQGRLVGEHTYNGAQQSFEECPENEFIDLDEVRDVFAPLIIEAREEYRAARTVLGY